MAVGSNTYKESDGHALDLQLQYTVDKNQVAYIDQWLVVTNKSGDSGGYITGTIIQQEYQFVVPSGLGAVKGDIVYVDVTDLTGHLPDESAYGTSSGGSNVALFKATSDPYTTANGETAMDGIFLGGI